VDLLFRDVLLRYFKLKLGNDIMHVYEFTCFPLLSPTMTCRRRSSVEKSSSKSSASYMASLSFPSQSLTAWLWACCSSASKSTAWMVETVFLSFLSSSLKPQSNPICWRAREPELLIILAAMSKRTTSAICLLVGVMLKPAVEAVMRGVGIVELRKMCLA